MFNSSIIITGNNAGAYWRTKRSTHGYQGRYEVSQGDHEEAMVFPHTKRNQFRTTIKNMPRIKYFKWHGELGLFRMAISEILVSEL